MSGHKCVWAQTCVGTNVCGHKHVWAQSCLGTNVCGHNRVWAQTCVGTIVSGHNRVWAQSCLGTIVSGHNRVSAQSCLGTIVSGHNRVWAQSCGHNRVGSSMYGHNRVVSVMSRDIQLLEHYFRQWYLKMSTSKSISAYFHLYNREENETLKIQTVNGMLPADKNPKYLGVTLDRSLTYRKHIDSDVQKLKKRNNLLRKISGTTWGASQGMVRTSALALCYSVAEYACPVWNSSSYVGKVDTCLNNSMRTISGALK